MPESLETIRFYYDYKSPFTYLALEPAFQLEQTHRIRMRPLPLDFNPRGAYGGELEQRTERDWRKVRYLYLDVRRHANARGMIIRGPQKLFDSSIAMMAGIWADRHGKFRPFSDRVFERFFKRELNIEDISAVAAVVDEVGLDSAAFRKYAETDGPGDLKASFAEGERDGAFGVPTFVAAGELFWGNDRVVWLAKKLDAMGLRRESK
ncbi:MAG TPA: DsbA family protein [Candidatus Binataceae bacterium]|nr:DsbA family protein [Candidatus Binataceae bacterium]